MKCVNLKRKGCVGVQFLTRYRGRERERDGQIAEIVLNPDDDCFLSLSLSLCLCLTNFGFVYCSSVA